MENIIQKKQLLFELSVLNDQIDDNVSDMFSNNRRRVGTWISSLVGDSSIITCLSFRCPFIFLVFRHFELILYCRGCSDKCNGYRVVIFFISYIFIEIMLMTGTFLYREKWEEQWIKVSYCGL